MLHTYRARYQRGFTLIEMAIILVVIGFLVGAILFVHDLLRNNRLRASMSEFNRISSSINTFRGKYNALPGDMTNAASYWAGETNGNGDGAIAATESDHAWRHLAKSAILAGSYTGTGNVATTLADSYVSKWNDSVWSFVAPTSTNANTWWGSTKFGGKNFLHLGGVNATYSSTPTFQAKDVEYIDTKMDDGIIYEGKILGPQLDLNLPCEAGTAGNYYYASTVEGVNCTVFFMLNN